MTEVRASASWLAHALLQPVVTLAPERDGHPLQPALLDSMAATPHPVSPASEFLEHDLHSLAQAAMEARIELDDR